MSNQDSIPETRLSVRLSGPLAAHANRQVESALYSSHSEYVRDLIRRDMANDQEVEKMRSQIIEAYGQLGNGNFQEVSMNKIWYQAMDALKAKGHKITDNDYK